MLESYLKVLKLQQEFYQYLAREGARFCPHPLLFEENLCKKGGLKRAPQASPPLPPGSATGYTMSYLFQLQSHFASKRGQFKQGKVLGNASLILSVIAIVVGFVMYFAVSLMLAVLFGFIGHCGLSGYEGRASCQRGI